MPATLQDRPSPPGAPKPIIEGRRRMSEQTLVIVFITLPLLALLATVPAVWGWGLAWLDIGLAAGFYLITGLGVTVGFHRYFTHGSFKAHRALRNALAIAGSM